MNRHDSACLGVESQDASPGGVLTHVTPSGSWPESSSPTAREITQGLAQRPTHPTTPCNGRLPVFTRAHSTWLGFNHSRITPRKSPAPVEIKSKSKPYASGLARMASDFFICPSTCGRLGDARGAAGGSGFSAMGRGGGRRAARVGARPSRNRKPETAFKSTQAIGSRSLCLVSNSHLGVNPATP